MYVQNKVNDPLYISDLHSKIRQRKLYDYNICLNIIL